MRQCEDLDELLRSLSAERSPRRPLPSRSGAPRSRSKDAGSVQDIDEFLESLGRNNACPPPCPYVYPATTRPYDDLEDIDVILEPLDSRPCYHPSPPEAPLVRAVRLRNLEEVLLHLQDAQPDDLVRAADAAVSGLEFDSLLSDLEPNARTTYPLRGQIALGLVLSAGTTLSQANERSIRSMMSMLRLKEEKPLREQLCANLKEKL